MSSVSVEVHGKRHTVRVSPMAPLSAVIEAALSAEGVTANTAACRLLHGTKALDAATPLRFANLPAAAKLELITGQERHLGMDQPISAPRLPASPRRAASSPRGAASPHCTSASAASAAGSPFTAAAAPAAGPQQQPGSSGGAAPFGSRSQAATADPPQQAGAQAQPQEQQQQQQQQLRAEPGTAGDGEGAAPASGGDGAGPAAGSTEPAVAVGGPGDRLRELLGREASVFSRAQEAEAAAASASGEDLPDSFYEFTGDDYARVARGWGANFAGPPAAAHLKTAKMRAAEAAAAARLAPPIPVRVMFPNAMVLQATFVASDTVSALQEFVTRAVVPGSPGLHLYTAPPKAVLQQPKVTVYEAGLAPAAVVYAGCKGDAGPALRPEVLALQGSPPSRSRRGDDGGKGNSRQGQPAAAAAAATDADAPAEGGASAVPSSRSLGGARLPKWLKTSK